MSSSREKLNESHWASFQQKKIRISSRTHGSLSLLIISVFDVKEVLKPSKEDEIPIITNLISEIDRFHCQETRIELANCIEEKTIPMHLAIRPK